MTRPTLIAFLLCLLALPAAAETRAASEARFQRWLETDVWSLARHRGITRATWEAAMSGITLNWDLPGIDRPDVTVRPQKQQEFGSPGRYFRESTLRDLGRIGRAMESRHAAALARAERRTGVPARIVLAIWGRESGFGQVPTRSDAFRVLATRGFFGPSQTYFRGELLAALEIAQARKVTPLTSSWAGALGQPQFMPSSYLAYATDGNGDGRVDIWDSDADSIASIARFLAEHGWQRGRDWGYEVRVPAEVSCTLEGPDSPRRIAAWARMGVVRVSGRPFPKDERTRDASLLMPAGRYGPAFLVTPNFSVLKDYNRSDLYALFIGNAADRIEWGMGAFAAPWRDVAGLHRSDVSAIQAALIAKGHDTGGADGLAGYKTRRAIGAWQEKTGRAATCYPDARMRAALGR